MDINIAFNVVTTQEDLQIVQRMAKEIWNQHYVPIIGQAQVDYMLETFHSKKLIEEDMANGCIYRIVRYHGNACGYYAIQLNDGVFLSKFYVLESYRGKGIGKSIFQTVLEYAKENNANSIWLTCNRYNINSLRVYKRLGFVVVDSVDKSVGNGFYMNDYILKMNLK